MSLPVAEQQREIRKHVQQYIVIGNLLTGKEIELLSRTVYDCIKVVMNLCYVNTHSPLSHTSYHSKCVISISEVIDFGV